MWRVLFLLLSSLGVVHSEISDGCLQCICQVESQCQQIGCQEDMGSLSCGPYQIKYPYWNDCYRPGAGWKQCTQDFGCAADCVRTYTGRFGTYCTGGRTPTCEDYARIHNGGPLGCRKQSTLSYWLRVKQCLGEKKVRDLWFSLKNRFQLIAAKPSKIASEFSERGIGIEMMNINE